LTISITSVSNKELPIQYKAITAVIDVDSLAFHVAAACEKASISVTHKEEGWSKAFKTRTEFKGRTKKTITGWLGEQNEQRVEQELPEWTPEDFLIEDVYEVEPIEFALYSMKRKLESVIERCSAVMGTTDHILVMGSGDNHRHSLALPKRYKWNREDSRRPELLTEVRNYLRKKPKCVDVKGSNGTGIEADDYIAALAYKGWKDWKKTGVFSYAAVCEDKDQLGNSGLAFNPRKEGDKWIHSEPVCVDGLGSLYKDEKGKVRGDGFAWLMFQSYGDKTDGYDINDFSDKRLNFGDVARLKTLETCTTPSEYLKAVYEGYKKVLGDTVKYTTWEGDEVEVDVIECIDMIFTCAYMLKSKNDKTSFSGLCEKYGVDLSESVEDEETEGVEP